MTNGEYVTGEMKARFWADGVVLLPQVLEPTWMDLVELGIKRNLRNPGPYFTRYYEGTPREFVDDHCNYEAVPEYQMLVRHSPIVDVVAAILGSERLWLFYDQIFIKDASAGEARRTPWHQDTTYWMTAGSQLAAFWITVDDTPVEESLEFVRGSHRGPTYAGTVFDYTDDTAPYTPTTVYPRIPDIEADRDAYDIIAFPIRRGDAVLIHPATLHGGGASTGGSPRRTLSLRFFGDDVVYKEQPRPSPKFPGTTGFLEPGEPLRGPWFPQVLPHTAR